MKSVLNRIIIFAFVYVLTFYLAHFSAIQSVVLAALMLLIVQSIPGTIEQLRFTPFWLRIEPNYPAILKDVGLLENENDWRSLVNSMEDGEEADIKALKNGFYCYVLTYDRASEVCAVVWPMQNRYTSQIDFSLEIDCITKGNFGSHPSLRIKPGKNGYYILLNVSETWFEEGWFESIQAKLQFRKDDVWDSRNFLTGTVDLPLAVIPYEEIRSFYLDTGSIKQRKAALAKYGWTEEKSDWELDVLGAPVDLTHRYVKIAHREI